MQNLPPAKSLGFLLQDVSRLLRRRLDQRAQTVGLTSAQWRVLAYVARCEFLNQEPPNQASLADFLDMEPITLSRQIDRIEAAKLIERRPDPNDRRAHRLFLTENARPLVEAFRAVALEMMEEALVGISPAEVDKMVTILARIRANVSGKPNTDLPFFAPEPKSERAIEESTVS